MELKGRHISVLLKKDWITLKRNWVFVVAFIVLPLTMMTSFTYLESLLQGQLTPEQHNFIHTAYSKKTGLGSFMMSNMSTLYPKGGIEMRNVSTLSACKLINRKDIGVVLPKELRNTFGNTLKRTVESKALRLEMFNNVDDFFHSVRTNLTAEYCFGFELSDVRPGVPEINVTFMFPIDASGNTYAPLYDLTSSMPDMRMWNNTFLYGTSQFMVYVTDMIITLLSGHKSAEIELAFMPMKTPAFNQLEPFASQQLTLAFPFFYMCIYLLPLYYIVTKLAEEKESKAREGMKIMGLRDKTYFTAWFIFLLGIITVISTLIVAVCSLQIFARSSLWLVFLMSILYGMTLFGFAFIIVAFFPTKKSSATAATLLHLLSFYVAFAYQGYSVSAQQKTMAALIPNCAMAFMIDHIFHCELDGVGMSEEFAATPYQNFSFTWGLIMLTVDVFLYALVGYYLDQVVPREIGVARPWNFPCKRQRRRQRIDVTKGGKISLASVHTKDLGEEVHGQNLVKQGNFEPVAESVKRDVDALKVRGLRKVFSGGKVAVDEVSMTMYSGQIFALLGHNGAGKTTTISMLTGLLEHSSGSATVFGVDIFEDMDTLRDNLGVCPQHNVLFDYLTAREHLELYAGFKGVDAEQIKMRVDKVMLQTELSDVQHQLASTLSGGQKRRLSVGIALIGDSKIVMLDEPTSGMDTTTRRRFWEIMKQYKENRIIILTTHYMDEADVLGDRICIMAEGKVQCCGSSLFLKKRFGVGYNLVLAKKNNAPAPQIDSYITAKIPSAVKLQEVSSEMTFQFPTDVQSKFKDFFTSLDKDLDRLGVNSYGVGITTLEEVFLRIGHGEENGTTVERIKSQTADLSRLSKRELELTEYSIAEDHQRSFLAQCKALVLKRLRVTVRDKGSFFMDSVFPVLFIFFGLWVSTLNFVPELPMRSMSVYEYPQGRPLIVNNANFNQTDEVLEFVERTMGKDVGEGKLFSEIRPVRVNTSDHFFNQTKTVDEYLFNIRNETGPQYGQLFVQQARQEDRYYALGLLLNSSSPATIVSYAAYACQSIMRDLTNEKDIKFTWRERPMPLNVRWQTYVNSASGVLCALAFAVAYMMVSDTQVQSLIKERQMKIKHQIIVSGGSKIAYWASNYFVDLLLHSIPAVSGLLAIHIFEIDAPDMAVVFAWFIIVNPVVIYAISFLFDTDSQASVLIRVFYFGFGAAAPISIIILNVITKDTKKWGDWLEGYFYYVPIYNLDYSYLAIQNRRLIEMILGAPKFSLEPLDWEIAGAQIYNLQCVFVFCFSFVFLAEVGLFDFLSRPFLRPVSMYAAFAFGKLRRKRKVKTHRIRDTSSIIEEEEEEKLQSMDVPDVCITADQDPLCEEQRVESMRVSQCAVLVSKLSKSYKHGLKAVDNLSFGLEFGECFALLGITGAGKTTTFKCLTGEEVPDEGKLFMGGYNVRQALDFNKARCLVGYCPQFDAIFELLTVREHLEFYSVIKGVRSDLAAELVDKQLAEMDLTGFSNVQAGKLSGGNKRKLSCAMALIGNPPIVLLDEPSTGVDPQAKRFMWTIISNISTLRKKSTVILTTHSMEEAEALCTKMGIMVNGQFKCFGSSQHIKDKYGSGFEIEVKLCPLPDVQLNAQKQSLAVSKMYVKEDGLLPILNKLECASLYDEIRAEGLGENLFKTLNKQKKVLVDDVLRWAHIEKNGLKLRKRLEKTFKDCVIVEHYSNAFKFRVSRGNHSIGFVFGQLEDAKKSCQIEEYCAMQTTLEQIFNMFARQANRREQPEDFSVKKEV